MKRGCNSAARGHDLTLTSRTAGDTIAAMDDAPKRLSPWWRAFLLTWLIAALTISCMAAGPRGTLARRIGRLEKTVCRAADTTRYFFHRLEHSAQRRWKHLSALGW